MRLFTRTITIHKPREAVFDFFVDFSQSSRWRQSVRTMELIGGGPIAAGRVVRTTWDLPAGEYTLDLTVQACDRPSHWRHGVDEGDFYSTVDYSFDPSSEGTRVTMRFDIRPTSWYVWVSLPLLVLRRRHMYREQLPQLKRAVENT